MKVVEAIKSIGMDATGTDGIAMGPDREGSAAERRPGHKGAARGAHGCSGHSTGSRIRLLKAVGNEGNGLTADAEPFELMPDQRCHSMRAVYGGHCTVHETLLSLGCCHRSMASLSKQRLAWRPGSAAYLRRSELRSQLLLFCGPLTPPLGGKNSPASLQQT